MLKIADLQNIIRLTYEDDLNWHHSLYLVTFGQRILSRHIKVLPMSAYALFILAHL